MHTTANNERDSSNDALIAKNKVSNSVGSDKEEIVKIKSRFGNIEVNTKSSIYFQHGLLGFPGKMNFCVVDFPDPSIANQFKLLQSIEDHNLSFIVIPAEKDNQLIDELDTQEACKVLEINSENLLYLFIVTTHVTDEGRRLSVNARAPIMMDISKKSGAQYVFQNTKYSVRHMIS